MGTTELILGIAAIVASLGISTVGGIVWYTGKQDAKVELVRKTIEEKHDKASSNHARLIELLTEGNSNTNTLACQVQVTADVLAQVRDEMRVRYALKEDLSKVEERVEHLFVELFRHVGESSRGYNTEDKSEGG